jgi:hypothetical protein
MPEPAETSPPPVEPPPLGPPPADAATRRLLKKARNAMQADIWLLDEGSAAPRVLKDASGRPWLCRALFLRWTLGREARALRALEGTDVAPRLLSWDGKGAMISEFVRGDRLPKLRKDVEQPPPELFDALAAMVERMGAAGVAHGDLRRANVLWDRASGSARFIDFESAVALGPNPWFARRWLFRALRASDIASVEKMRRGSQGDRGEAADHYPWPMRLGRWARRVVYKPFKRLREKWFGGEQKRPRRKTKRRKKPTGVAE